MTRRPLQSNPQASNPAGSIAKKSISRDEWNTKLADVQVDREDLNKLIMNYLIIEGYKDAAEKFSQESGAKPPVNLESIQDRMIVRTAIQRGNIEEAIERVNDLNPEILDTNPKLFFHLQQQRLIEYIREGRIMEALEFAQEELAPRGEENLPALLKMCWYAQQQLDERCTFPKIKDFTKAELVMEPMGSGPIGGASGASGVGA
ncbi:hypothetical protein BGZ81_005027 [Podila clonocystis]|nr:hypothetical protein BGZ81_005027 [Podila clonocystis]